MKFLGTRSGAEGVAAVVDDVEEERADFVEAKGPTNLSWVLFMVGSGVRRGALSARRLTGVGRRFFGCEIFSSFLCGTRARRFLNHRMAL